jgi:alkylhydroperoxidase family enzyme
MHTKEAKLDGERELRLYHLPVWRESTLFTDKERAALEWTELLTTLPEHGSFETTYARVREQLSEKEISDLTFAVGVINFWNRLRAASPTVPGSLDDMFGLTKANLI